MAGTSATPFCIYDVVCRSVCYDGNVCRSIFVVDGDVDLPWSPFAYAALTSFRDDAVGLGIQTVRNDTFGRDLEG